MNWRDVYEATESTIGNKKHRVWCKRIAEKGYVEEIAYENGDTKVRLKIQGLDWTGQLSYHSSPHFHCNLSDGKWLQIYPPSPFFEQLFQSEEMQESFREHLKACITLKELQERLGLRLNLSELSDEAADTLLSLFKEGGVTRRETRDRFVEWHFEWKGSRYTIILDHLYKNCRFDKNGTSLLYEGSCPIFRKVVGKMAGSVEFRFLHEFFNRKSIWRNVLEERLGG